MSSTQVLLFLMVSCFFVQIVFSGVPSTEGPDSTLALETGYTTVDVVEQTTFDQAGFCREYLTNITDSSSDNNGAGSKNAWILTFITCVCVELLLH